LYKLRAPVNGLINRMPSYCRITTVINSRAIVAAQRAAGTKFGRDDAYNVLAWLSHPARSRYAGVCFRAGVLLNSQ